MSSKQPMSNQPSCGTAVPDEVQLHVKALRRFASQVSGSKCSKCCKPIMRDFNIKSHYRSWREDNQRAYSARAAHTPRLSDARCNSCSHTTCLGCGGTPSTKRAPIKVGEQDMSWCCNDGRLVSIWMVAAYFDEKLYDDLQEAIKESKAIQANPKATLSDRDYIQNYYKGNNFVNMRNPYMHTRNSQINGIPHIGAMSSQMYSMGTQLKVANKAIDHRNELLMSQLATLLSDKNTPFSLKHFSPDILMATFYLSFPLDAVAELLRNDSLDEVASRQGTYLAALAFMERLFQHSSTRCLVTEGRYVKKNSNGLVSISISGSNKLVLDDPSTGKGSSIGSALESLQKQCQTIITTSTRMSGDYKDDKARSLLKLCNRVLQVASQFVSQATQSIIASRESPWEKFHSEKRVQWVSDETIIDGHHYERNIRTSVKSTSASGRLRRLVKEIANMSTSLPCGIFLKVASSRPDCMRLLIVGTENTPYENGIYEFDVFAGSMNYPNEPPQVWYPRKANSQYHFSPNIHADGKVCLSILNTFPGRPEEMWQSISTLYQVFVSIQLLILCENPMTNVPVPPSFARMPNLAQFDNQIRNTVEELNIWCMILPWLRERTNERKTQQLWDDVLRNFFQMNHAKVLDTVKKCAKHNARITKFTGPWGLYQGTQVKRSNTGTSSCDLVTEVEKALKAYLK